MGERRGAGKEKKEKRGEEEAGDRREERKEGIGRRREEGGRGRGERRKPETGKKKRRGGRGEEGDGRFPVQPSSRPSHPSSHPQGEIVSKEEPDLVVMQTKSKILEILKFIMDVRLDLRITNLLVIYKKQFAKLENDQVTTPSEWEGGGCGMRGWRVCGMRGWRVCGMRGWIVCGMRGRRVWSEDGECVG